MQHYVPLLGFTQVCKGFLGFISTQPDQAPTDENAALLGPFFTAPIIITNAALYSCENDYMEISLETGNLDSDLKLQEQKWVLLRHPYFDVLTNGFIDFRRSNAVGQIHTPQSRGQLPGSSFEFRSKGATMPRMRILTKAEHAEIESPPVFNSVQRNKFFEISDGVEPILHTLRTPVNKIGFLLSLGYFRATKRFFGPQFQSADVDFVATRFGYLPGLINMACYDRSIQSRHRKLILEYLGFREFGEEARREIVPEIRSMVRSQMRPKNILRRVVEVLESRKTEVPGAYTLTDLVVSEARMHRQDLTAAVDARLSHSQRELLDALLDRHEAVGERDLKVQRFRLTLLKKISQSLQPSKIKMTVEDSKALGDLYRELGPLLWSLDLTHEGVRYYANTVIKAEIFQLSRRADEDRYLHLICFVGHQFLRMQDTLVDILLNAVQNATNACKREHKEKHYAERASHWSSLKSFVKSAERGAFTPLAEVEALAFRSDLSDSEKIQCIQQLLTLGFEDRVAAVEKLDNFRELSHRPDDAGFYDILESKSVKLQNRVAEIVKHIVLEGELDSPLSSAIRNYKRCGGAITQSAPAEFLSEQEQKLLIDGSGKFRVSLYKSLLFVKVAEGIRSGALNLKNSYKYRSLDDYLIPKHAWQADRESYLDRADLRASADCRRTMEALGEALGAQYDHTNRRILDGENPHFHLHKDGRFHVSTPKVEECETESTVGLFPEKRYVSLLEVLSTVNGLTRFLDEFQHLQVKYNRSKPEERTFLAGIIGYGCFIGTHKIARISNLIRESELDNTVNWYFTLENIDAANDRILKLMDELELPDIYRKNPGTLHTSSDGQRYDVTVDSLNSNFSFKYHGNSKGVTAYEFLDQRDLNWHGNVISSGEKEAHYVIDGLMHNEVVKSDIHSTDTDGYSEVVFGVTHLLGFRFAPRLKNLKKRQLFSFPHQRRKDYEDQGFVILPDGCKRLIKNAIVCWNYLYASGKIADEKSDQRKRENEKIRSRHAGTSGDRLVSSINCGLLEMGCELARDVI
jgi:hypothetical protein